MNTIYIAIKNPLLIKIEKLEKENTILKPENDQLKEELLLKQHRPPEKGGSYYELVKTDFKNRQF